METLDISQLADYLSRDVREVGKLAVKGILPGRKVNGEWRFTRAEITHWLTSRMHQFSATELDALESAHAGDVPEPLLGTLLSDAVVAVPLNATTRSSVLRELVRLAEGSWQVYDFDAVLQAITSREEMGSTALTSGIAIPHASRPLADTVLGEPVVAFARTARQVPMGGPGGGMTDLFFLVLSKDDRTHVRVLARLARLLQSADLVYGLRAAEDSAEALRLLLDAERALLGTED